MKSCWIFLFICSTTTYAFCPEFFKNQTACSCYNNIDGAVVRCSGPEGPMVIEEMKQMHHEVRELSLENANIVEIGPHAFKNLRIKKLVLDKNHIRALHKDALAGLENVLMELSIANNRLTKVPSEALFGLRAMNVLNLRCNRIGNLTEPLFQNTSTLIDVDLSCNKICDIADNAFEDVRGTLQNLILDSNCMKTFPGQAVKNMDSLIALHVKYNQLETIEEEQLTNLTSLSMLTLTGNNISRIDQGAVVNVPNLHYLYLGENSIKQLDAGVMGQFKPVQVLDLSFNEFEEITQETLLGLDSLQHINLDSNQIKTVAPKAFEGMPLLLLWLPNNCIDAINKHMFQGAPFLRQVSLANNNIRKIEPLSFAHLANLHHLDMANNKIRTLEQGAITGTDHLTVRLQENPMVCSQDGFHVMNGNEAINLTTEANNICKTAWEEDTQDKCPKAQLRPARPTRCGKDKPSTKAIVQSTTSTTPSTTSENSEKDHSGDYSQQDYSEEQPSSQEEDLSAEVTTMESTTTEEVIEESTTSAPRKVNMDRFLRLQNTNFVKRPSHHTRKMPKYMMVDTTNESRDEEEEESDLNSNEEEDEEYEEDYEEEDESVETTTRAQVTRRVPARVRNRQHMLNNLPPWLRTAKPTKSDSFEEEFNQDGSVEEIHVDESHVN